ncbi:MAG: hypothetical protein NXY57DRAFT_1063507 [Lentinula lateritia]|nr:MAG: hypothetical protein NXY57DRAFT_1063507 [Lentinula lateritia]
MCSSQARTAPLFTTNSIFVPPITGKGPPFRHLLSTNETPRLFMLIDKGSAPSFSSDPLSLLSECSHLTSFDSIPSTPPPTVSLALEASNQQALQAKSRDVQLDAVTRYFCNVGFPNFQLDDPDESSEDVFVRCVTTDKNTKNKNYTQGQEDHHPQSPTPSSGDAILSCWESGSQFSYHGCDLEEFGPIPCQRCQRGSLTIPNLLMPDLLDIPNVKVREVEDVEKDMVRDGLVTGVPAGSFLGIWMRTNGECSSGPSGGLRKATIRTGGDERR